MDGVVADRVMGSGAAQESHDRIAALVRDTGDRTVHYFRLDLGPWSCTGYGTLERDLLGALRAGADGRRRPAG